MDFEICEQRGVMESGKMEEVRSIVDEDQSLDLLTFH